MLFQISNHNLLFSQSKKKKKSWKNNCIPANTIPWFLLFLQYCMIETLSSLFYSPSYFFFFGNLLFISSFLFSFFFSYLIFFFFFFSSSSCAILSHLRWLNGGPIYIVSSSYLLLFLYWMFEVLELGPQPLATVPV